MPKKRESDYCRRSGKKRFRDRREAIDRLHSLQNKAHYLDEQGLDHTIGVKRTYKCPFCKGWHLTSQPSAGPRPAPAPAPDPLIASLARLTGLQVASPADVLVKHRTAA